MTPQEWTDPQIGWIAVSSDGYVTTDADFLGRCSRPRPQFPQVAHRGRLVAGEREEFARLFRQRVDDRLPAEGRPDYAELLH